VEKVIEGEFVENSEDPHTVPRRRLLGGGAVLPPPAGIRVRPGTRGLAALTEQVGSDLRRTGLAVADLGEPLADEAFMALGARLGTLIPERDPVVLPYVDGDVLLNLLTTHGHTDAVSLQPFSTNSLSLHTEGSGHRVELQPRYIALLCCDPGASATETQTLLVPMESVHRGLSTADLELLARTRYGHSTVGPFLVRAVGGRTVFSFRDFRGQPLKWVCTDDTVRPQEVNGAIRRLLAAMYQSDAASGIHWKRGLLVIIDNTFFFHGRVAGDMVAPTRRRHLKRLRIR
jgi:alpha-ketoglutarate-dependent taurine dioxygenase